MKLNTTKVLTSIIVLIVLILAYFSYSQKLEMDQKRADRTHYKNEIDKMIAERYKGMIIKSELDGHCGIALYEIKVLDQDKLIHELKFNMDTGEQVAGEITDNCDDLLKVIKQ